MIFLAALMSPRCIWNTHTTGLKYPKGGVIGKKISVEKKAKLDILNLESSAGGYAGHRAVLIALLRPMPGTNVSKMFDAYSTI